MTIPVIYDALRTYIYLSTCTFYEFYPHLGQNTHLKRNSEIKKIFIWRKSFRIISFNSPAGKLLTFIHIIREISECAVKWYKAHLRLPISSVFWIQNWTIKTWIMSNWSIIHEWFKHFATARYVCMVTGFHKKQKSREFKIVFGRLLQSVILVQQSNGFESTSNCCLHCSFNSLCRQNLWFCLKVDESMYQFWLLIGQILKSHYAILLEIPQYLVFALWLNLTHFQPDPELSELAHSTHLYQFFWHIGTFRLTAGGVHYCL